MLESLIQYFSEMPAGATEVIGVWVAALLTLAVLSAILGYNPAFRLAEYLLVGVAAGYAGAIAWSQALWPRLRLLITEPATYWYYAVFFILGLLLLTRGTRAFSRLGNLPLGVLFGTGAALALGGALSGSLVPQVRDTIVSVRPGDYGGGPIGWIRAVDAALVVFCTVAVFSAFHFTVQRRGALDSVAHGLMGGLGSIGRKIMIVAFGALLAGAAVSFFIILRSRLDFLIYDWVSLFADMGM